MFHLSEPIHQLQVELREAIEKGTPLVFDVLVVGSGYGGAVAAARFAEAGLKVLVLERGKEYVPGEFPNNLSEAPSHVRIEFNNEAKPWGYEDALFDIRVGAETATILGNGLGGGSQINANVALEPELAIFNTGWPTKIAADAQAGLLTAHFDRVKEVVGITSLSFKEAERRYAKSRAFGRLAAQTGDKGTKEKPLLFKRPSTPLAVKFSGIDHDSAQPPGAFARPDCNGCGNCVTGCNVGAKGTLTTNYLPIAKGHGARLVTGATALVVEKTADDQWLLTGIPTLQRGRLRTWEENKRTAWTTATTCGELKDQFFEIKAKRVVLSAGTLGTAEILQRSRKGKLPLTCSDRLGEKFSGNGDYLAFSYGETFGEANKEILLGKVLERVAGPAVNAVGWATSDDQILGQVGPTITATLEPRGQDSNFIVQDGAIPGPIAPGVQELWAFANAFLGADKNFDPIALDPEGKSHTQTFLGIGNIGTNEASGEIAANPKTGRVHVAWPKLADHIKEYEEDFHRLLRRPVKQVGGTYLNNPPWRPLPPLVEALLGKEKTIRGVNAISHPLGGCVMADDAARGVVDHCGRVFSTSAGSAAVHAGLYVLDGSVIHGAVGVNPFLTIAALAERAVETILLEDSVATKASSIAAQLPPAIPKFALKLTRPVELTLSEVLRGEFSNIADAKVKVFASLELTFGHADIQDWFADLSTPFSASTSSTLRLKASGGAVAVYTVKAGSTLTVLAPKKYKVPFYTLPYDKGKSVATYDGLETWPNVLEVINRLRDRFSGGDLDTGQLLGKVLGDPDLMGDLINVFVNALQRREIAYDLSFEHSSGAKLAWLPNAFKLSGSKKVSLYSGWNPPKDLKPLLEMLGESQRNVFSMITEPTLQISHLETGEPFSKKAVFAMDLADTLHRNLPQIKSGDTTHGLVKLLGYPMVFLRFMLRSLLLNFSVPVYARDDGLKEADASVVIAQLGAILTDIKPTHYLPALQSGAHTIKPMLYGLPGLTSTDGKALRLAMWRYKQAKLETKGKTVKAVLMLHAFGQSALSFADESITRNGATVLHEAGYDVWLLEYRTSTALDGETKAWADDSYVEPCRRASTMGEVAAEDIPAAVKLMRETLAKEGAVADCQVFAFAQCVGAASLAMSALRGHLKTGSVSHLAGMVLSQFTPYSIADPNTQARTSVPPFLRDVARMAGVNFSTLDSAREAEEAAAFKNGGKGGVDAVRALKGSLLPRSADAYTSSTTDTLIDIVAGAYPNKDNEIHHGRRVSTPNLLGTQAEVTCRRILTLEAPLFSQRNISAETFRRMPILFGHANIELFDHCRRCVEYERLVDKDGRNIYVTQKNIVENLTMPLALLHGEGNQLFAKESTVRGARMIGGLRGDNSLKLPGDDEYDFSASDTLRTIYLKAVGHLDPIIGTKSGETFDQVADFFNDVFIGKPAGQGHAKTPPAKGNGLFGIKFPTS